jgi:hypothetical protein
MWGTAPGGIPGRTFIGETKSPPGTPGRFWTTLRETPEKGPHDEGQIPCWPKQLTSVRRAEVWELRRGENT